jgi:hypothetical protein
MDWYLEIRSSPGRKKKAKRIVARLESRKGRGNHVVVIRRIQSKPAIANEEREKEPSMLTCNAPNIPMPATPLKNTMSATA